MGFNFASGLAIPQAVGRSGYGQVDSVTPQVASHGQGLDGAGGVRMPPTGQFDASRPCFLNGQWMLPLGTSPYPYALHPLMASPGYMGGQYAGSILGQAQIHAQMPAGSAPYPNFDAQGTQNAGIHRPTPLGAPTTPPISSIRPSQITRSHIESLKQNLKRVEDQLQYNVHQIDVKHMEGLAREIRHSIKALEDALPRQLEFEELHYPKPEKQEPRLNGIPFGSVGLQATTGGSSTIKENGVPSQVTGKPSKAVRGIFSGDNNTFQRSVSSDSDQSRQFSGLPMTAAAATPFQPSVQPSNHGLGSSSEDGYKESREAARKRFMSLGGNSFREMAINLTTKEHGTPVHGKANAHQNGSIGAANNAKLSLQQSSQQRPYLVGSLPPGSNSKDAVHGNFIYPRELTAEEIRARHLYWGQAPRSAMKGLPKFDGKDFYPPSPSKVREDVVLGALGTIDSSQTATDPFSSTDSRKTEGPTIATSCSESEDLVNGHSKKKKDGSNVRDNQLIPAR